jgi:tetratricopeptide (TPR) repeat protein
VSPILIAAAAAAQSPTPAAPAPGADANRFQTCVAQVRAAPEQAVTAANAWVVEGGGLPARQCLGLAFVALGRWASAATVYEQGARAAEAAGDSRRADFWVQAGNAWLASGDPARALQALDAALATPLLTDELRGEVHLDRAQAMVAQANALGARGEVDRALELVPADPFGWYLSAAIAELENNLERARSDIARARELAPEDPDIMLLAGTIAGLSGNGAETERLYRAVIAAAPESDAARRAQAALATMRDVPPEGAAAPGAQTQQPPQQPAPQPR